MGLKMTKTEAKKIAKECQALVKGKNYPKKKRA